MIAVGRPRLLAVDGNNIAPSTKSCLGCGGVYPVEDFGRDSRGYSLARCKPCRNAQRREYRKRNPERHKEIDRAYYERSKDKARGYYFRVRYGITLEEHTAMLEAQGGLCALCGRPPSGERNRARLHVDHDHETGVVRRLLCSNCNNGLGHFRDDPDLLRRAALYIEEFR